MQRTLSLQPAPEANPQRRLLDLGSPDNAFACGGNRLCFVDPRGANRCIKTLREDRSPRAKRDGKPVLKRLKPLACFDDNRQEAQVFQDLERRIGSAAYELIPRLHGFVNTNLGEGLCCDLIRDDDGRIALSLKQYLWQYGKDPALTRALVNFSRRWQSLGMPSRRLLLHNIVVQCQAGRAHRLYVIDGLGWPDLIPLAEHVRSLSRYKAGRRLRDLETAIAQLLARQAQRGDFGIHGWLSDANREH